MDSRVDRVDRACGAFRALTTETEMDKKIKSDTSFHVALQPNDEWIIHIWQRGDKIVGRIYTREKREISARTSKES